MNTKTREPRNTGKESIEHKGSRVEMFRWSPSDKREDEEELLPWRFAGWRLEKTGPKTVYILKIDGEDFLHFHVETEALVTTPRSTLRKFDIK